jgi:hypothetical protein
MTLLLDVPLMGLSAAEGVWFLDFIGIPAGASWQANDVTGEVILP